MDDALARTGAARGQREYTLPTARAFAHMPTAFDHYEIHEELSPKTGAVPHCDTASPSLPVTECGKERPVKCELVRETTPCGKVMLHRLDHGLGSNALGADFQSFG